MTDVHNETTNNDVSVLHNESHCETNNTTTVNVTNNVVIQQSEQPTNESLAEMGYNKLILLVGDRHFCSTDLMELVAMGTSITSQMQVSNLDKKAILIRMVEIYINNNMSVEEQSSAQLVLSTLDVSINVLFNFGRGVYCQQQSCQDGQTNHHAAVVQGTVSLCNLLAGCLKRNKK